MKFYAGIGSRETPTDVLDLMEDLALKLDFDGFRLRTGIAPGADQAFARGAGVNAEWSLPWESFEQEFRAEAAQLGGHPEQLLFPGKVEANVAKQYHPAWDRLGQGAQKLHARNVLQVLGRGIPMGEHIEYPNPSAFVICWTKDGKASGGTGQAIRIAQAYGITVQNLHNPVVRNAAQAYVEGAS